MRKLLYEEKMFLNRAVIYWMCHTPPMRANVLGKPRAKGTSA